MKEIEIIINGDKLERVSASFQLLARTVFLSARVLATVISRVTTRCIRATIIVA